MARPFILTFVTILLSGYTLAWGELGHRTVGYLAELYFTPEAENMYNELANSNGECDISDGAVWPDEWKVQRGKPWSKPWHFIDANDTPPEKCEVKFKRDCNSKSNCVIGAITNLTTQVNNPDLDPKDQGDALKWLIHFLGDITQPLHTENKCRGGTKLMVQWGSPGSKEEDLHAVWDKLIPQKLRGYKRPPSGGGIVYDKKLASKWAKDLKEQLDQGSINVESECTDIETPQECALKWASESNAYVCTYVLKDVGVNLGPDPCETCCAWDWQGPPDLSEGYYEGAVPIVEEQIGKAGWRLGRWINALAQQRAAMKKAGVVFKGRQGLLQVQPKEEM